MATPKQMRKLIELFENAQTEELQALLTSGLLADLRDGDFKSVKRDEFRHLLGLSPIRRPLLTFIDTVEVPKIGRFDVSHIKVGAGSVVGVDVGYVDPAFMSRFGNLFEEAQTSKKFNRYQLNGTGGLYQLISRAINGAATIGQILWMARNGKVNNNGAMFNAFDRNGILCVVSIINVPDFGGWRFYVNNTDDTATVSLSVGAFVFSCNS